MILRVKLYSCRSLFYSHAGLIFLRALNAQTEDPTPSRLGQEGPICVPAVSPILEKCNYTLTETLYTEKNSVTQA